MSATAQTDPFAVVGFAEAERLRANARSCPGRYVGEVVDEADDESSMVGSRRTQKMFKNI